MRINVNLATNKYQDPSEFYLRWGGALVLGLLATVVLGLMSWADYRSTATDRKKIDHLRSDISNLDHQYAANQAILNRPENKDVRDQSSFWNEVIDQKRFSWTQLFSDLEKVMPGRAFVINVQPSVNKEHRVKLRLMIGGEKHEDAVDLMRNMEHSQHFRNTALLAENSVAAAGRGPSFVQFDIEAYYTPESPAQPPRAAPKGGMQ